MAKLKTITKEGTLQPIAVENHGVSPQIKADIETLKQGVSGLDANVTELQTKVGTLETGSTEVSEKVETIETTLADKANKSEIPSLVGYATESWVEGKKYLTDHQDISNLATKTEVETVNNKVDAIKIPTKVSELTNDSEFQTKTQVETIATDKAAAKVAEIVDEAPENLDTLKEIAEALSNNDDAVAGIVTTLATKANKDDVDAELAKKANSTDITDMLTKTEASDTYQPKGNYLTQHQSLADYAKTADVNTELAKKVDKVTGKSLVSDTEITKLSALPTNDDLTTSLNAKADKSTTYTKTEVNTELAKKLDITTHNTDKTALETAIGSKANSADVYTKTAADDKFETIANHNADKAEIDAAIALCETKADHKKDYDAIMARLNDVAQTYSLYGMARANGDSTAAGAKFFGDESNLKQIAGICHTGLVDNKGKLYKRCANGRIDLASDGTELYIDGSDGDVMVYIDRSIYVSKFTDKINVNGAEPVEMNVFALGLAPFSIEGHPAKEIKPFAFSPQYTVNCKLDATNTAKENGSDKRSCAHSIYNKNVPGTYKAPRETFKNNTFKPNGKGFPNQNINSMQSIWNGQCKNDVETTNRPFMGGYYEFTEIWLMLMFLENKSLYHQALDDFGCGSTMSSIVTASNFCTDSMNGNSGVKIVSKEGNASYAGLMTSNGLNGHYPLTSLVGDIYYGFTEMLETQRLLNDIAKAGLVNKIWKQKGDDSNKSVIFEYNTEGKIIVSDKTIADITDVNIT